jgi:uncharacterized protein (TIGR03067 family)
MRIFFTWVLLLIVADDPARRELDKYQGTWVLVSEEFQGKPVPAAERPNLSCTVRGDRLLYKVRDEGRSATVELDPTARPKHYDLAPDDGQRTLKAIYAWDGDDTIKICSADDQGDRPKEFKTGPGSRHRIRVWKRQK